MLPLLKVEVGLCTLPKEGFMRGSGLKGSFPLSRTQVDAHVSVVSPGIFALGHRSADGSKFTIARVGRSDADVNRRLRDYIGQYSHFKFGYSPSSAEAFEKECALYHQLNPRDNKAHPPRPAGTIWRCPKCEIFDTFPLRASRPLAG
jgi:hypothetical protein